MNGGRRSADDEMGMHGEAKRCSQETGQPWRKYLAATAGDRC